MNQSSEPCIYKCSVAALTDAAAEQRLRSLLAPIPGIERVDVNLGKRLMRIVSATPLDLKNKR